MADFGIAYARAANLVTAFTKGGVRCLRWGSQSGTRAPMEHVVQLVAPDKGAWKRAKVYLISLSPEVHAKWSGQPKNYFVVAESDHAVASYLQKRYTRIAAKWMGTARYALVKAQEAVSTRNVSDSVRSRLGSKARQTAEGNLRIRSFGSDNEWTVQIEDNLAYAAAAFKRTDAVQYAMAKAANSIAGMLRKRAGDILDPSLATPFPEISNHRRSA